MMCYPCCDSARVKSLKTCHCLHEIPEAFNELKPCLLEEASEVTDWFENNHVLGRIRQAAMAWEAEAGCKLEASLHNSVGPCLKVELKGLGDVAQW